MFPLPPGRALGRVPGVRHSRNTEEGDMMLGEGGGRLSWLTLWLMALAVEHPVAAVAILSVLLTLVVLLISRLIRLLRRIPSSSRRGFEPSRHP